MHVITAEKSICSFHRIFFKNAFHQILRVASVANLSVKRLRFSRYDVFLFLKPTGKTQTESTDLQYIIEKSELDCMRFWSENQGVYMKCWMRVFAMVGSEVFVAVKQCVSNKERGWQAVSPYGMCLANCADFVRETLCICEFFILTLPFKVTVLTKKRHSRVLLGIHWGFFLTKNVFIGCFSGAVAHLRSA